MRFLGLGGDLRAWAAGNDVTVSLNAIGLSLSAHWSLAWITKHEDLGPTSEQENAGTFRTFRASMRRTSLYKMQLDHSCLS